MTCRRRRHTNRCRHCGRFRRRDDRCSCGRLQWIREAAADDAVYTRTRWFFGIHRPAQPSTG